MVKNQPRDLSSSRETTLVTGGAGFIGSHLVDRLVEQRKKVIVLDNLSSGRNSNVTSNSNVRFVCGDIRDAELVDELAKESDIIFHLAEFIPETRKYGSGHVIRYSMQNPLEDFDISCRGTLILLEKARKYSTRLVFASSAAVYGEPDIVPTNEDSPTLPCSPYGASKLCAETYTRMYARIHGLQTTILRFFNVYGPRQQKYVMYDTLLKLKDNSERLEILGSGEEVRDFIFVSDVVDAILLVARDDRAAGHTFNIGTGIQTSIKDLVELVLDILGKQPQVVFTENSWKGDIKKLVADIKRIESIGFKPKFELESGLRKLVDWFNATGDV